MLDVWNSPLSCHDNDNSQHNDVNTNPFHCNVLSISSTVFT